jgi:hypothetical protein
VARPTVDDAGRILDDGSNYPTQTFPTMHTAACPYRNVAPSPTNTWYYATYADSTRSSAAGKLLIVIYCQGCGNNRTFTI